MSHVAQPRFHFVSVFCGHLPHKMNPSDTLYQPDCGHFGQMIRALLAHEQQPPELELTSLHISSLPTPSYPSQVRAAVEVIPHQYSKGKNGSLTEDPKTGALGASGSMRIHFLSDQHGISAAQKLPSFKDTVNLFKDPSVSWEEYDEHSPVIFTKCRIEFDPSLNIYFDPLSPSHERCNEVFTRFLKDKAAWLARQPEGLYPFVYDKGRKYETQWTSLKRLKANSRAF